MIYASPDTITLQNIETPPRTHLLLVVDNGGAIQPLHHNVVPFRARAERAVHALVARIAVAHARFALVPAVVVKGHGVIPVRVSQFTPEVRVVVLVVIKRSQVDAVRELVRVHAAAVS